MAAPDGPAGVAVTVKEFMDRYCRGGGSKDPDADFAVAMLAAVAILLVLYLFG